MLECTRFKSLNSGALQGFADIFVPKWGVEIKSIAVFMRDGRRWISMPGREYTNAEGQVKNAPFMWFKDKNMSDIFSEEVKKAVDKWCAENQEAPQVSSGFTCGDDLPF